MSVLPQTAWAYAMRGVVTAALLMVGGFLVARDSLLRQGYGGQGNVASFKGILPGLLVGLLVFVVWIAPEGWVWSAPARGDVSPYHPQVCGWALTLAKLAASAFVISVAEELFFRKWLVEFAGFGWMLVLFGVEHMRWDLGVARGSVFIAEGVFAGLCYGLLAKKYGIVSAIVAHAVTNLVLGLYVIGWDKWFYW